MKKFVLLLMLTTIAPLAVLCAPTNVAYATTEVSVSAKAAYAMDYDTGTVIFAENENARLPIASMVKIMTTLLAFEAIDRGELSYNEKLTISADSAGMGGSQIFLDADSEHTIESLIKSVVVASANDSCHALAERIGGSEQGFVKLMNKRAAELSMTNTHFSNCSGLPAVDTYSSAKDVSTMFRELLSHERYFEFCAVWLEDYVHPDGRTTTMTNTNKLIRFYKGCDSGKTGFTSEAMFCLSASAKRGDMRVIATVIGAPDSKKRFSGVSDLFNYAFGSYENKVIYEKGVALPETVEVVKGRTDALQVVPERNVSAFTQRGEDNVIVNVELPEKISAPIKKGDAVGRAVIVRDGVVIGEVTLLAAEDVEKARLIDYIKRITSNW
jgi:D-alanyl-D-alanine carboxypeptidase